jgi:hypothetical protein
MSHYGYKHLKLVHFHFKLHYITVLHSYFEPFLNYRNRTFGSRVQLYWLNVTTWNWNVIFKTDLTIRRTFLPSNIVIIICNNCFKTGTMFCHFHLKVLFVSYEEKGVIKIYPNMDPLNILNLIWVLIKVLRMTSYQQHLHHR